MTEILAKRNRISTARTVFGHSGSAGTVNQLTSIREPSSNACRFQAGESSDLRRFFLPGIVAKLAMNKKTLTDYSRQTRQTGSMRLQGWKLREAKAKFSRVVRVADSGQPQRVTVRGKDAVIIDSTDEFERLRARAASDSLHELLSESPLNRLDFDEDGVQSPVRDVEL